MNPVLVYGTAALPQGSSLFSDKQDQFLSTVPGGDFRKWMETIEPITPWAPPESLASGAILDSISEPFTRQPPSESLASGPILDAISEPFISQPPSVSVPILDTNPASYFNPANTLLEPDSFLMAPPAIVPQPELPEGNYIDCSPVTFSKGIIYKLGYIKDHFPALHQAICDARILAKHYVTIHGLYDNVQEVCHGFLVKTITFARNTGRPA